MHRLNSFLKLFSLSIVTFSVTGCLLGPNFHSPKPPLTNHYTEGSDPHKTTNVRIKKQSGRSQEFVYGQDIPGLWWHLFHSKELNELIREGLINSPNLRAAKAALTVAKENYKAQFGSTLLPSVNGQATFERQLFNASAFGGLGASSIFNLYNVSVNVSYTLDLFGGLRRELEVYGAQVDYEGYEMEAALLSLTSNIVTTTVAVASYEAQIRSTKQIIQEEDDQLNIYRKQLKLGGVSGAEVYAQENQVEQLRATLPPLLQLLDQSKHALAALLGAVPSETAIPEINLDGLHLPLKLPVSLPSRLIRQRPDVKAAEALLHAASAQIGVATANLFPQLTITGIYGWESSVLGNLFKNSSKYWNYSPSLLQPIFAGGSLRAKRRAAIAGYQQAEEQYRQVVVTAFQNVADSLKALEHDAQTFRMLTAAEVAAKQSFVIAKSQYALGGVNYLYLLNAERTYHQAKIESIKAQAARYSDTAALFQSLGGGWWNLCNSKACLA